MQPSSTIDQLETKPHWRALAMLPWLLALGVIGASAWAGEPAFLTPLIHLSGIGILAQWYTMSHTSMMRRVGEGLRIDERGVWRGHELLLAREEIRQGFVRPDERHGVVLQLQRSSRLSRDLRLAAVDEAQAREALRTLGVDASQKVATLTGGSRVYSLPQPKRMLAFFAPLPFAVVSVMLMKLVPVLGIAALVALFPMMIAAYAAPSRFDVGVDGVLVRWLGTRKFIPFERVARVEHFEERDFNRVYLGVRVHLDDGSVERLVTGQKRFDGDASRTLHARLEQALDTYRRGSGEVDASALARREQRPLDWVRRLRAIALDAQVGPRRAPIAPERLLRIAVDPAAPPTARASAAVAAAPTLTPEDRAKLRIATETTASPKLRIALERAVSSDATEEALAEALAELEAEEAETRRA